MESFASTVRKLATDWQLAATVLVLASTGVSVLLNLSFYRQVLGFGTFTLLPGFLIVRILRLNGLGLLKKSLLSLGLGVGSLMIFGLIINTAYMFVGYMTPLGSMSLTISLGVVVIVLFLLAYKRCDGEVFPRFWVSRFLRRGWNAKLLFPITLPILAIAGTQLMNATNNNLVLLLLLFLLIGYGVFLLVQRPKNRYLYPFSLWMISISSILILSLRSQHIIGYDVHWEYQISAMTLQSLHWAPSQMYGPLGGNLTVGLLPAMYSSLLGIEIDYVYKAILALLFSITPIIVFASARDHLGNRLAFAASLFFVFQGTYAFVSQSSPRTAFALVFFALAIMVLLDRDIRKSKKTLLTILLMSLVMVSHYATAIIFLIILAGVYLGRRVPLKSLSRYERIVEGSLPVLYFAMIFFWYGQVTGSAFTQGVDVFQTVFRNLGRFFLLESRHEGTMHVMGAGVSSVPDMIYSVSYYVIAIIIAIGVLSLTYSMISNRKSRRILSRKPSPNLTVMMMVCSGLLAAMILLPRLSTEYTMDRLWTQMIIILSGAFVVGCAFLSLGRQRVAIILVATILVFHFFAASFVIHQAYGVHKSMVFNSDGPDYSHFYVRTEEVNGAEWLGRNMNRNLSVFTDFDTGARVAAYGNVSRDWFTMTFFDRNDSLENNYLFLGYYEVVLGQVYTGETFVDLEHYRERFDATNKVFDNGGVEIFR